VMTSDCPTRPQRRHLAVVASSLAGATLAVAPTAIADPPPADSTPAQAAEDGSAAGSGSAEIIVMDSEPEMGLPVEPTFSAELVMIAVPEERPAVEWSVWGRLGAGIASQRPEVAARSVTVPAPMAESTSTWDAAASADLTFRLALDGDLRAGPWGELRTTSDPVAGGELVLEDLPPHGHASRIGGTGSLVLRAGANLHVVTGELGFGYVGSWPRGVDPWVRWARHVVGARVIVSVNRDLDEPHDWSATVGLEVEPIGAVEAVLDLLKGRD